MNKLLLGAVSAAFLQCSMVAEDTAKKLVEETKVTQVTNLEEAVKSAIENHPALSAARKARQAAESIIDEAEAEFYPTVDLRVASGRDENENDTVLNDGDHHRA